MKQLTTAQIQQARKQIGQEIGHLGGEARAKALSAKRRKEIAKNAANVRWDEKRKGEAK